MSNIERLFLSHAVAAGLPTPVQEHPVQAGRRWRFDFAWPDRMVALEVEGGTHANGRHSRASGYQGDVEKYNAATLSGWSVYRATGDMVRSGEALRLMVIVLQQQLKVEK